PKSSSSPPRPTHLRTPLSLHDALPISFASPVELRIPLGTPGPPGPLVLPPVASSGGGPTRTSVLGATPFGICRGIISTNPDAFLDRKSTRLNLSHVSIS